MSKPISAGDLVVTVKLKPCCGAGRLGFIFRVTEVREPRNPRCLHCADQSHFGPVAVGADEQYVYDLCRLKRIPPLDELDTVKHDEEITA